MRIKLMKSIIAECESIVCTETLIKLCKNKDLGGDHIIRIV